MRFRVPQFLDIQDKIFGPFTFRQFIYIAGGLGGAFALWKIIPKPFGLFLAIPFVIFAAALTFYKINNKPFLYYVEHGIKYFWKGKIFIWKKPTSEKTTPKEKKKADTIGTNTGKFSESKLQNIAWSLDVLDKN
ncbi:MAG: hypothetical protein ACI9AR_000605 [Flavobacteriaceae bacterium]|jgi:hypothetical protein